MAKAKSKKITIDEMLVPVEEQPFAVPENWCWVKLSSVISTSKEKMDDFSNLSLKYVGLEHIEKDRGINGYGTTDGVKSLKNVFHAGQILYGKLRPYLNKHDVAFFDGVCSTDILVFDAKEIVDPRLVNMFFDMDSFISYAVSNSKGINLPRVSEGAILDAVFPLPPISEQQRIVEQVENLFSKLDEAKEKAALSLESFDKRKEAILYKAFRGDLTEKYRNQKKPLPAKEYLNKLVDEGKTISKKDFNFWNNSDLPAGWVQSKIGNLLYFAGRIGWKGLKAEEYTEEGPLFLSVYNLNDGDEVTFNRVYHITKERYEESPEIMVQVGDVLLTKDGAGIGKLGYVKELPQEATINSSLLLIRPGEVADSKYVFYLLSGPELQEIVRERITGSATPHLFQRDIKEFLIPIPPMEEQKEIVSILDDILSKEYQANDAAKMLIEQVDFMKKAILVKAFRGELGSNDPSEESSIELLRQIIES